MFVVSPKQVLKEYNAGFDSGTKDKAALQNDSTPANIRFLINENVRTKMLSGIKDGVPLVRAYWQGYYDAMQGWHRNTNYTQDSKPPWPKD